MTEHETNPQRHETPSVEPADASHESSSSQDRGQSSTAESYGEQPTAQQPIAPQSAAPQSAAPQSAAPQSGGAPQQPAWSPSPWQQPQAPQQPGYAGYPGYAAPQQHPQYAGAYAAGQGPTTAQMPAQSAPPWAQPVVTEPQQQDPAQRGRGRRIFVAGAAAVLIALGAGGVGAATALALTDGDNPATVRTGDPSVTRVVDRSSLAQIAAAVQDSVVSITTESGEGSGVILSADGYVLTNNHVVASATGKTVSVIFANGKKATADIIGTDPRTDMAVVKASGITGLKPAEFGDSSKMQVGDTVLALGSPLGLEGSVTAGIISAKDRTIQSSSEEQQTPQNPFGGQQQQQQQQQGATSMSGLLQTDAPINPGNSGGALVNVSGQVIGINSAIATSGQDNGNIGLGFAIPSNKAKTVADDLIAGRKVSHAALGVNVAAAEGGGALVVAVVPGSGAAEAGLQKGDVITTVNGKPVNDSDDVVAVVQAAQVNDKLTIVFTRDGAQKTITATLHEAS